jgi:hypothetical protein
MTYSLTQLSNQLRDSSTAHTHTQAQQRVAAAAPVPDRERIAFESVAVDASLMIATLVTCLSC